MNLFVFSVSADVVYADLMFDEPTTPMSRSNEYCVSSILTFKFVASTVGCGSVGIDSEFPFSRSLATFNQIGEEVATSVAGRGPPLRAML